jgi:class 3 adenylate cyclase
LRARLLTAEAVQVAVWPGRPGRGGAGTARDVARWRAAGRDSVVIASPSQPPRRDRARPSAGGSSGRVVRCLLFADVAGYTRMDDNQLVAFQELVGGAWASALADFGDQVLTVNTWGDAVFVVLSDVAAAARCAIALRDAFDALDLAGHGLPQLGLRVAGHVGPIFEGYDAVAKRPSWTGVHVNRAARLEPVTPAGEVYVTEAFAAALELAGESLLRCEYVGHLPTAKGYDPMRMHRLHQAPTPRTSPARPG